MLTYFFVAFLHTSSFNIISALMDVPDVSGSIHYAWLNLSVIELVSLCDMFIDLRLKIGVSMTQEGIHRHPCIHGTQTQIEREYS